ncbi:MFS transporter [Pseudonocardia cypriaca]|uniref:EmrB/QacA subfamily drug resistance transporter n=1 Tax=Pseudonocardia cypriaca TaxID=882449 RepID=A0A543FWN9_9PSEU|nr:MFS transporter [Pseudonocardia cypriaca]TQM38243.1 EmrB/QacA subfamily drug resistance transporter [Pseudonocardia cypriaca]
MDHHPATSAPRGEPALDPRRWQALALLGTAFFMVILDSTIVLTAIPSMQAELGLPVEVVQWVLTGYALAFGGLMLLGGRVADLWGRRRVFVTGLALFGLSSLACGLAWTAGVLLAARAAQGVSAAIMAPTALSLVMTTFREGAERNKALAVWGGLGGVGATAGLLAGGLVTAALGWEWVFFLNVPIAAVLIALCPVLLRESRDPSAPRSVDVAGAVTVTGALVLLVYAVVTAPETGWASLRTIGLLVAAAVLLGLFVLIEARAKAPLVPLRVFRLRTLVAGNVVLFTVGLTLDGMLFPLTLYAQQVLEYSPLQAGLLSAAMTVTSIAGAFGGQAVVARIGLRRLAVAGIVPIVAGCVLLLGVTADGNPLVQVVPAMLVFGAGLGAAFVACQIAALAGVAEEESGLAAGLIDTSFNLGNAIGIAIATSVAVLGAAAAQLADPGIDPDAALTDGLRAAFGMTAVAAALALVAALVLLPRTAAGGGTAAPVRQ